MSSMRAPIPLRRALARVHVRLTLFAIVMATLTVSLVGFTTILRYADQNQSLVAETASYVAAPAIVFNDQHAAQAILAPLLTRRGVAKIQILVRGQPFASVENSQRAPSNIFERQLATLFFQRPQSRLIEHAGRVVGEVRVSADVEEIARYVLTTLAGSLACLVVTGIATGLLARRLDASVARPLEAISALTQQVRAERRFDLRAPKASIREVDMLGYDFNALIAEMERWDTRLRSENEELSYRATHDSLTRLPNRPSFERQLAASIAEAGRMGQTFVVMFIDGDHFKEVNDQRGHRVGDAVLIAIADRLRASIGPNDMVARLGGDEFAVILSPPSGPESVTRTLEAIGVRMREPIMLPDSEIITISVSIGTAMFPADGIATTELLARADAAMYDFKSRSRGIGKRGFL